MSELKIYKQSDILWGHWFTEYCRKDEADKVITEKDKEIAELKAENDSLLQQNHEICEALSVMYSKDEYNQLKVENERLKARIEEIEHDLHRMRSRYECEG